LKTSVIYKNFSFYLIIFGKGVCEISKGKGGCEISKGKGGCEISKGWIILKGWKISISGVYLELKLGIFLF